MKNTGNILLFASLLLIISCRKQAENHINDNFTVQLPLGFPEIPFPEDNPFKYESWLLGKHLFYDTRLSKNNDLSCASCHKQHLGFADNVKFSHGDNNALGTTNAPTLTNVAFNPYYLFAGGVPTLEMQVLVPIQEHNEFNTNILDILEKLEAEPLYQLLAQVAYQRNFDAFVFTRSIATFQRSLISGNSRYDQHFQQNKTTLNASEIRGHDLFFSTKTNCFVCHGGFNFTNFEFENNGLYAEYSDMGRMLVTHSESDRAKFKVPTLRNIALTAPYMHDGSLNTLEEVVEHYNQGGAHHPNKNPIIQPLGLTALEKQDLINFLKTLTDDSFVNNPAFAKP